MIVTSLFSIIPASAAEPTISTDKTIYGVGEAIIIEAHSDNASGKDWVGIAPLGIDVGTIRWEYFNKLYDNFDITKAQNIAGSEKLKDYMSFPPGKYVVYLIKDDMTLSKALENNGVLDSVEITIIEDPNASLKAPLSVEYELKDASSGLADGTLSITLPEGHYADDVYMWWADDNGALEDYTRLARFKVPSRDTTEFVHNMTPNTLIPAEATGLLVYTFSDVFGLSEECVRVDLPEGAGYDFPSEAPITEFQVVSDIHIGQGTAPYAERFEDALRDIVENSPESAGIFVNGDTIDTGGKTSLWTEFWEIYDSVEGAPDIFLGIGNHEYYGLSYNQGLRRFIENMRMPEGYEKPDGVPYYDLWVNGFHYIFLGDASGDGCTIGDEQYDWLEDRLEEKVDDRPVFVFFHQPMKNTVAGSMESEGWWELSDDARMREILAEHPEIFFFNGHTHWILDSYNTMYGGGEDAPIFNTSSVAYLWHSYDIPGGEWQDGSEGYYIKVYEDKVLVLGRDFMNGKWVSSAQFLVDNRTTTDAEIPDFSTVDTAELEALIAVAEAVDGEKYTDESYALLSEKLEAAKAVLENAAEQEEVDEALAALKSAKDGLVEKTEQPTEKPGDATAENPEDATAQKPEDRPDDATDGKTETKGGCGSSLAGIAVVFVCGLGAVIAAKKRR